MGEDSAVLTAVRSGDESAFGAIAEQYRRQLHVHCYRMTGSVDDAEDLVPQTMLRAWRSRASSEGRSSFRNWLHRIATNACLNSLERSPRRVTSPDGTPATTDPRSVTQPTDEEQALLQKFMEAFERADAAALTSLLRDHAHLTMHPALMWFDGRDPVMGLYRQLLGPDSFGDFKLVATAANRQPAAVAYLRARGKSEYRLTGLNVLRIVDGIIAEVTAFRPDLCKAFHLPSSL